jgi:hypothetical protein
MDSSRSKPGIIMGLILVVSAVIFLYVMVIGNLRGRDSLLALLPSSIMLTAGGTTLLIRYLRPPISLMDSRLFALLDGIILGIIIFFLGLNIYLIVSKGIFGPGFLHVISFAIFLLIAIALIKFGFVFSKERPKYQGRFTQRLLDKLEL